MQQFKHVGNSPMVLSFDKQFRSNVRIDVLDTKPLLFDKKLYTESINSIFPWRLHFSVSWIRSFCVYDPWVYPCNQFVTSLQISQFYSLQFAQLPTLTPIINAVLLWGHRKGVNDNSLLPTFSVCHWEAVSVWDNISCSINQVKIKFPKNLYSSCDLNVWFFKNVDPDESSVIRYKWKFLTK